MVWLPMDLKPDMKMATEEAVEKTNSVSETVESLTAAGEGRHKKLLLIEDNKEFRAFLKEQLEDFYQILETSDGEEGEKYAIEENPVMIVSDIIMPKGDGIELCRRIKTNVQTSHIPVILLTACTADDIEIKSYEVGADSYVSNLSILIC